jgi:NifU-like protein involved in Fe-S cluster formation
MEGLWVKSKEIKDLSGLTHGVGWCAPQQGGCKLSLNIKQGIIEEALVEIIGCSGATHSAAMAAEILPGKTVLEALNTDLVCDAINTAMRQLFMQIVYGRSQTKTASPSAGRLRIWARASAPRWAPCTAPAPRA